MQLPRIQVPALPALPPLPAWLGGFPLASVGLAALSLLVSLGVLVASSGRMRDAEQHLQAAVSFVIQHPVVEVDARLLPVARSVVPGFESNEMFAFLRNKGHKGDGAHPQVRADELSATAFAALDAHPSRRLGVVPTNLTPHGFVTHVLVHAGWAHLIGGVLLLLLLGPTLELLWGRAVFVSVALLMVLVSAGVYSAVHAESDRALLGLGALVSGLTAAAVVRFRDADVDLLGWLAPLAEVELEAPAWALLAPWAAFEATLWWTIPSPMPEAVDHAVGYTAHAAAALVGAGAALGLARLGRERDLSVVKRAQQAAAPARFDFDAVLAARERGDDELAWERLDREVRRNARHRDAVTLYWRMAIERGESRRAVKPMLQLVREEIRRGADDVAVGHWRELSEQRPEALLDAQTLLRLVGAIRRSDGDEQALVALQQVLDPRNPDCSPASGARAALLVAELDPERGLDAARAALRMDGLDPAARVELEALVARESPADAGGQASERKPARQPPSSVFYEESDRSAFGEVDDLTSLDASFPTGVVQEATPLALEADGLRVAQAERGELHVEWLRVRAVAVVGVRDLGPRPVLLVDVLVDGGGAERPLSVLRLRSDRYDPRALVPEAAQPLDAIRILVERIVERGDARAFPDAESAALQPPRMFESVDAYETAVLRPLGPELA